ncbi:hypothetical protein QVL82_17465, partial [Cellulosimicrobium funkei]
MTHAAPLDPTTATRPPATETPYVAGPARRPVDADALRARVPGWGVDLDPRDRPSYPREVYDPAATGAHWDVPEQQPELRPRERSVEHAHLTPVFGTSAPLHGASGAVRGGGGRGGRINKNQPTPTRMKTRMWPCWFYI